MVAAVTDAYADVETYRSIIANVDSGDAASIDADLITVSRHIDRITRRFFTKDANAVARRYTPQLDKHGENTRVLVIDDVADLSGIELKIDDDDDNDFTDETALAATDYRLTGVGGDLNVALGPQPHPWEEIHLLRSGTRGSFPAGKLVQVTAIFGWPSVPNEIVRATCHLTAILRLESPRATRRTTELGEIIGTSRQAIGIVEELVMPFKKWRIA